MVLKGLGKEASPCFGLRRHADSSPSKPRQAFVLFRNGDPEVTTGSGAVLWSYNLRKLRAMATRLKLKTVWRRHWQRGPHLRFFSTFLPYCLICNRWSARAFLLVFLEKAVLISQVQITRLHLVSLAVCVWESRDTQRFCTTET